MRIKILKNILSLSTGRVLHDPAESSCIRASRHVRGNDSYKIHLTVQIDTHGSEIFVKKKKPHSKATRVGE